jgi:hypothetical protein
MSEPDIRQRLPYRTLLYLCIYKRLKNHVASFRVHTSYNETGINTGAAAIAQAISRRLPTAAARVRSQVTSVGFVVDKVALGQVFSEHFGFLCKFSFHRLLQNHCHIVWGWYNRPNSGRPTKWTQSHPTSKKTEKNCL